MSGSWRQHEFPDLNSNNCSTTSHPTKRYNCFAWAAGEMHRRWEPDPFGIYYWPPGVPREVTLEAFVQAYGTLGFSLSSDGSIEDGTEKIAIFGNYPDVKEPPVPTHAAFQLESGKWTSKLGDFEDIAHDSVHAVNGPAYGKVICFLSRSRNPGSRHPANLLPATNF